LIMKLHVTFLCCLLLPSWLGGQLHLPADGFIFSREGVPRIDLQISPEDLTSLYADPYVDVEYPANFTFTRGDITEEVTEVGVRFRGNTSRDKIKKSFKVSFNSFERGRKFHGLEKMNLNAETNDPSLVRSMMTWELFRYMGVPGSRINHVLLYINQEFMGVYLHMEHIDEQFVKSRFGTNDGNLYKCLWPASLEYKGNSGEDYKYEHEGRRAYEIKTNAVWDDYRDLSAFIRVLDMYSGEDLPGELENVFNTGQYLKAMAVDVMTGNWDGYVGNKNNYYLYRDQVTGRFEYIPYDLDNTFGIDWIGFDWTTRPVYDWRPDVDWDNETRPLYEKLLQVGTYRKQYSSYLKKLATYMQSDEFLDRVDQWRSQIAPYVESDTYYTLDRNYGMDDFNQAMTTGWGGHVPYGVTEYIDLRVASAMEQVEDSDAPPAITHVRAVPGPEWIRADWWVEDDQEGHTAWLRHRTGGGVWTQKEVTGAALTDPVSGIMTYMDSVPSPASGTLELQVFARDGAAQITSFPRESLSFVFPLYNGPVFINEFMASNTLTVADGSGEFDDWVELYNASGAPVAAGELFLSDDGGDPGKFRLPAQTIPPGGYLKIWLDGQPEQGDLHAPFRINAEGEELYLSEAPSRGYALRDSVKFGPQQPDVSQGREGDGTGPWIFYAQSTPGISNLRTYSPSPFYSDDELAVYPNPVSGGILYFSRSASGWILNSMGQRVLYAGQAEEVDVGTLSPGMYFFRADQGEALRFLIPD